MSSSSFTLPNIPERISSKKKHKSMSDLVFQHDKLDSEIKKARKELKKAMLSFDSGYWTRQHTYSSQLVHKTRVQKKISILDFKDSSGEDEMAWANTQAAKDLLEREKAHALDEKLCARHAERTRTEPENTEDTLRNVFMQLYTKAIMGVSTSDQERISNEQHTFRTELIRLSHARHPEKMRDIIWCPIIGEWVMSEHSTAAHIFPYSHGEAIFASIFGHEDTLFSPNNGIMMSTSAEKKFDKGFFCIVPLLDEDASVEDVRAWHRIEPQRYKIRVMDPLGDKMNTAVSVTSSKTWNDLDQQEVQFKGNHRPRARYLYWHYCYVMLKRSWFVDKRDNPLRDTLGKQFWATPGPYMPKNMLLAFVKEMGHEYEALLEGAEPSSREEEDEAVETALIAANHTVLETTYGEDEVEDEDSDSDSDEETEKLARVL